MDSEKTIFKPRPKNLPQPLEKGESFPQDTPIPSFRRDTKKKPKR